MTTGEKTMFNPNARTLRQFAVIWIFFFAAIGAREEFHYHRHILAIVLGVLALTVGPLGVVLPQVIRPLFIGWMALAFPIGWTVSRIILGVIFYGGFTPIAWGFRVIGRDALALKQRPKAETYWCPKPAAADKSQYLSQF
jgi:hypothetical protein